MNHIRNFALFALIFLSFTTIEAQGLSYGVIIGTDVSLMKMRNVPKDIEYTSMYAPILGFNVNGFISYKSKSFWGISLEPGFIRKGGVQLFDYMNSHNMAIHYKVRNEFNSLELPVLFDIYLNEKLYMSAGFEFEYRLSEKAIMTDQVTWNDQSFFVAKVLENHVLADDILPDDNNRLSYSGLVGLHYNINRKFDLGLRYGIGLKELIHVSWLDHYGDSFGESNVFNNYLQLILKIRLN